jgi:anti-sigma factor RsiW
VNCYKVSHLLSAFIDGELLGHEHRLIHQHLRQCADCRNEYEELLQMKRLLAAMRVQEPAHPMCSSILSRIGEEAQEDRGHHAGSWTWALPRRNRSVLSSPFLGLGLGLGVVGLLLLASPRSNSSTPLSVQGSVQGSLVWETADMSRDEPAPRVEPSPHVAELTSGLPDGRVLRSVSVETAYPDDAPNFPLSSRRSVPEHRSSVLPILYR